MVRIILVLSLVIVFSNCGTVTRKNERFFKHTQISQYRNQYVNVSEETQLDPELDFQKMTVAFYQDQKPVTISFKKFIIPGKFLNPEPRQYAGIASGAPSAAEAEATAFVELMFKLIEKTCTNIPEHILGFDKNAVSAAENYAQIFNALSSNNSAYLAGIKENAAAKYTFYVTPQIDFAYKGHLLNSGKIDPQLFTFYYNCAILVDFSADDFHGLQNEILQHYGRGEEANTDVRPPQAPFLIIEEAVPDPATARILKVLREFNAGNKYLLGRNIPADFFDSPLDEILKRVALEKIALNDQLPMIKLLVQVKIENRYVPAPGAQVVINGRHVRQADSRGFIELDKQFLFAHCLKDGKIDLLIRFKYFRELEMEMRRQKKRNKAIIKTINGHRFDFGFSFRGRAEVFMAGQSIERKYKGLIFRDLKALGFSCALSSSVQLKVILKSIKIDFSFSNRSQRRVVDSYSWSAGIDWQFQNKTAFSLEINDPELLAKVNLYESFTAYVECRGVDQNRHKISVKKAQVVEDKK